jgi:hypothetical protein
MKKLFNKFSFIGIYVANCRDVTIQRMMAMAICLVFYSVGQAQILSPTVVTTAGNTGTSANSIVDWTLGEIAIETLTQTSSILTQGFHQNFVGHPNAVELIIDSEFAFYPNPARDLLYLTFKKSIKVQYQIELFNMKGLKVRNAIVEPECNIEKIDLNNLPGGIYLLKISTIEGKTLKTNKFVKL